MKAKIYITLKNGVLNPEAKAIQNALSNLGFSGIEDVKKGKFIEITLVETDKAKATAQIEAMCNKLLANTVIENYKIEL